ncbi:MAG: hypothetical protein IPM47_08740 [Sphingobacteriales bacterium]|nr:MAG: hypothetical protein IPM47_08740 [Sphingobacteriales bacterium]
MVAGVLVATQELKVSLYNLTGQAIYKTPLFRQTQHALVQPQNHFNSPSAG